MNVCDGGGEEAPSCPLGERWYWFSGPSPNRCEGQGKDWSFSTLSIKSRVIFSTVGAAGRGGRTTVKNRLKVAAAREGRVWASMVDSSVVEGAEGADGVSRLAQRCDMSEAPETFALYIAV